MNYITELFCILDDFCKKLMNLLCAYQLCHQNRPTIQICEAFA